MNLSLSRNKQVGVHDMYFSRLIRKTIFDMRCSRLTIRLGVSILYTCHFGSLFGIVDRIIGLQNVRWGSKKLEFIGTGYFKDRFPVSKQLLTSSYYFNK